MRHETRHTIFVCVKPTVGCMLACGIGVNRMNGDPEMPGISSWKVAQVVLTSLDRPPAWSRVCPPGEYRGLSPRNYLHINPYGRFGVEPDKRIDSGPMAS